MKQKFKNLKGMKLLVGLVGDPHSEQVEVTPPVSKPSVQS